MMPKVVFLVAFAAFYVLNARALSVAKLSSDSDESQENKVVLESIKEFVKMADKYNLNVSVIGSHKKYGSNGHVKESLSLIMHMPVNDEHYTVATLDDAKQDKYLIKQNMLGKKEHTGAKTRVIKIQDGNDELADEQTVNPDYIIQSPSYDILTSYTNGVNGFYVSENETTQVLHNYVIANPDKNGIANVQIITGHVIIEDKDVSENFPPTVLEELKTVLPKLWMSIDDEGILARILVEHLDKKFDGNFQVAVGVDKFALGGKSYANLQIADSNVLVFNL